MSDIEQTLRISDDGPLTLERLRLVTEKLPGRAEIVQVLTTRAGWSLEARWTSQTEEVEARAGHRQHGVLTGRASEPSIPAPPYQTWSRESQSDDYIGPYGSGVSFYDSH